jgi:hypothetical protein
VHGGIEGNIRLLVVDEFMAEDVEVEEAPSMMRW